ncbi:PASTA domain-containing protein [Chitinophaga caeni]|uniref:PASTA domain-containing protein n=1 Tax=Chitinophaga caeni TaxID=2029983 RepID=UPI0018E0C437|nr:Stk1 family PASTA domain-containing Ser/Thr kinase [Chitinophaga caeni]
MFNFITKKSFIANLIAAIIFVFVLALLFFFSLGFLTHHGETITVPDVRGKDLKEATAILKNKGFEVEVRDSIYIDSLKPLAVWEQTPERNDVVKVNRTIYLTINKVVAPTVAMPDLEGLTYRSAEMTLKSRRLRVGDTIYKPDFATNSVLKQMLEGKIVKPGTMIPEGSRITLVLSSGKGSIENPVPDLVGLTYVEARELLAARSLILGTVLVDETVFDTLNAFISKQTPTPKNGLGDLNLIRAGESIDIWLSAERGVKDSTDINQ